MLVFKDVLFLCMVSAALGLCHCVQALSGCGKWGYSLMHPTDFSLWWLLVAWALGKQASVVGARELSSCGVWA